MPKHSPKVPKAFWKNFILDPPNFFGTCPEHVQKIYLTLSSHVIEKWFKTCVCFIDQSGRDLAFRLDEMSMRVTKYCVLSIRMAATQAAYLQGYVLNPLGLLQQKLFGEYLGNITKIFQKYFKHVYVLFIF